MGPSGPANLGKRRTLRAIDLAGIRPTEATGPLPAGEYDVKLVLDDGFTELAATKIKVVPWPA
jgi:hypothetical protein